MTFSIHYALSYGSDISEQDRDRVLKESWKNMEAEGRVYRSRVDMYVEEIMDEDDEPLKLIDGFDYAITGLADTPHECVIYDYGRCIEILMIRDRLSEAEAMAVMEKIILENEDVDNGPIFLFPVDFEGEEFNMDDYDLLTAHEVVFRDKDAN